MNFYLVLAVFIFSSQVMGMTSAPDSLHTGYWKENTPKGKVFKCQGVTTESDMKTVLKEAGWESRFPNIDWNKQEAIIVAPEKYYGNKEMVFYGLLREKDSFALKYGWEKSQTDVEETIEQDGTWTHTYGSSSFNEPSTIVVSFPKNLFGNDKFYCSERSP